MAGVWLLIRAFSDAPPESWQLGDIVEVRDEKFVNEHGWGKLECPPRFYRLYVPDVDYEKAKQLLEVSWYEDTWLYDQSGDKILSLRAVRDAKIDINILSPTMRSALETESGLVLASKLQALNVLRSKSLRSLDI